jgi:hypothetical protein
MTPSYSVSERVTSNSPDLRVRTIAVGCALVATCLLWIGAHGAGVAMKIGLHNGRPPQTFGLPFLLGFALLISLLGWATLLFLERIARRPLRIWTGLAVVTFVLSFIPIAAAAANPGTKTVLSLIHIAVGGSLLIGFRRRPVSAQEVPES